MSVGKRAGEDERVKGQGARGTAITKCSFPVRDQCLRGTSESWMERTKKAGEIGFSGLGRSRFISIHGLARRDELYYI